jgi:hypothetical protein
MSTQGSEDRSDQTGGISRRTALVRGGATGAAAAVLGALGFGRRALAQEVTPVAGPVPPGWRSLRVEVSFVPQDPVSITVAGSGPPQRGDHFYIDAAIYALGDEGGTQIGVYQCFGAWTAAADNTDVDNQRLTTVRFALPDGLITGLINEGGSPPSQLGVVHGGTGAYFGAIGTFTQAIREGTVPGTDEATPAAAVTVVDSTFDLLLPGQG